MCMIQSRAACTPPRRKPLESDFETTKLISNGAYGWVIQTSVFVPEWLSLFADTTESPIKAEKKLKWGCAVVVFLSLTHLSGKFHFKSELMFSGLFFPPYFSSLFLTLLFLCLVILPLSLLFSHSPLFTAMQGCVSCAPQGNPSALCHEEDKPAKPDFKKSDPAGVCGARHPHLCWKPICGFYVLLFWDAEAPLHGDGVCGRWDWFGLYMYTHLGLCIHSGLFQPSEVCPLHAHQLREPNKDSDLIPLYLKVEIVPTC